MRFGAFRPFGKPLLRSTADAGAWRPAVRAVAMACVMIFMAADVPAHAADAPRELSVADYRAYLPETHSVRRALHAFADKVRADSDGRLRIRVWPGTVAGSPESQIRAVRDAAEGAPDIMVVAATGLAGLSPGFELFDLPYEVRDDAGVDAIFDGAAGDRLLAALPSAGLVGLGWMENGFRQLTSSRARIQRPDDLKDIAVRTLPSPTSARAFAAWGARPVAVPASGVYEALRSGAVEAQEGFATQALQSRLYEVQKHLWLTGHSFGAQVLVMNAAVWRGLDDADARILREAAQAAAREQRAASRAEAAQALAKLRSLGMRVHEVPARTLQALADATASIRHEGTAPSRAGHPQVSRFMQNPQ